MWKQVRRKETEKDTKTAKLKYCHSQNTNGEKNSLEGKDHFWNFFTLIKYVLRPLFHIINLSPLCNFSLNFSFFMLFYLCFILLSAFLRNCFLCWDRWSGDVMPTIDTALLCSSRAGSSAESTKWETDALTNPSTTAVYFSLYTHE